jgi:hypothetical protein
MITTDWVGMYKNLKIPNGVIRIGQSKDRQYNDQMKKDKRASNDLQNITQKTI